MRLPESCGVGPFARVAQSRIVQNESTPPSLLHVGSTSKFSLMGMKKLCVHASSDEFSASHRVPSALHTASSRSFGLSRSTMTSRLSQQSKRIFTSKSKGKGD